MAKKDSQSASSNAAPVNTGPVFQLHCLSKNCKMKPEKFGFCFEHYDYFKFGLINKKGEKVPDYDQKYDHYLAHKKVA